MKIPQNLITINAPVLERLIERKAGQMARQEMKHMKSMFRVGEQYSGREIKAEINFRIENLK